MKIEISDEGVVFCEKIVCSAWMDSCTCCDNCPIDRMYENLVKYQQNLAREFAELRGL